ncbi:MAG TPA: DUF3043 domain-containing protein [Trebonia sp.]|nr:DUF3043 domain-containing protein [Trebonia sp.]
MFRRSSAGATDSKASSEAEQSQEAPAKTIPAAQAGKGRPTPKRSQAERNRYRSIQGGTTSGRGAPSSSAAPRKLTPEEKAREKAERSTRYQAMKRGDESALGPRDRGNVRRYARNYVDSHRRVSNYMMIIIVLLIVALPELGKASGSSVSYIEFGVIAIVILDAYFLGQTIRRQAEKRYPNESTRGLAWYAGMRALQIRQMRFPKPQVKPGDKI